jgi:hypothetical protein
MRGQLFHNFMANEAKVTLARFFDQVQLEYRVRRNGTVTDLDLFACSDSQTLAVEVETTQRHAIDNARKAAAVDVPTWVIVPTRALQSRLLSQLEALDLRAGGRPICVLLLGQLEQALTHYLSWRINKGIQNKQLRNHQVGLDPGRSL